MAEPIMRKGCRLLKTGAVAMPPALLAATAALTSPIGSPPIL
ncbi:MAG TPA: hypothetical protein VHW09_12155 [Bryobacteraceae bacterium]|nr:hypothetical protein [Bryobacteraceae bacterium]